MNIITAHKFCSNHRQEILESITCACFSCLRIFLPKEIEEWTDEGQTAICPYCSVDSIIPTHIFNGDKKFLEEMCQYWFS